jgi:hypothetical protein
MTSGPLGRRTTLLVVAVVAGAALLLAGWWTLLRNGEARARPTAGWHVYPDAFAVTGDNRSGPLAIAALRAGCFTAVGMDDTGTVGVAATWTAAGDCSRPERSGDSPARTGGDGVASYDEDRIVDAVQGADGGIVAVRRHVDRNDAYGYDSTFLLGGADGWDTTGRAAEPRVVSSGEPEHGSALHAGPAAIAALPAGGYVAVGRRDRTRYPWRARPAVWTSATGRSWREAALPLPAGQPSATAVDVAAGRDGTLVAVGAAGGPTYARQVPVVWRSVDRGRHWRTVVPPLDAGVQLHSVAATRTGFTAVGGGVDERTPAVVLDSPTGTSWSVDRAPARAGARTLGAVVTLPDGGLLAVAPAGARAVERADQECAVAWHRGRGGTWRRESLGCHGVPAALAVLADGRVAAAAGPTLWLRDR